MQKDEAPIVIEQDLACSVAVAWDALTKVEQMRRWYFEQLPGFEAKVGFSTRFMVDAGERSYEHIWTVTEVVPGRKLVYDWRCESVPGDTWLTFELVGDDQSCHLTLTHRVRESFPADVPEFKRESGVAGWNWFIKDRLKPFVEG